MSAAMTSVERLCVGISRGVASAKAKPLTHQPGAKLLPARLSAKCLRQTWLRTGIAIGQPIASAGVDLASRDCPSWIGAAPLGGPSESSPSLPQFFKHCAHLRVDAAALDCDDILQAVATEAAQQRWRTAPARLFLLALYAPLMPWVDSLCPKGAHFSLP